MFYYRYHTDIYWSAKGSNVIRIRLHRVSPQNKLNDAAKLQFFVDMNKGQKNSESYHKSTRGEGGGGGIARPILKFGRRSGRFLGTENLLPLPGFKLGDGVARSQSLQ